MRNHPRFDKYLLDSLRDPEEAQLFVDVALEEFNSDGDLSAFLLALRQVAHAQGGMSRLARATKLNRANLYAALSSDGKPGFETINTIIHSLGLRFAVESTETKAKPKRLRTKSKSIRGPKSSPRSRSTSKSL